MSDRQSFCRPRLEALEDRLLMAALIDAWVGGVSDSYSVVPRSGKGAFG